MVPALRTAVILFATACLWTQLLVSSALTQEELLRAAITDFNTTSFELISDIKLTQNLPPFKLSSGKVRVLRIFSKPTSAFTISGARKYRGFWTPYTIPGAVYPVARLTFDHIQLKDFNLKYSVKLSNAFGSVGFHGGAIGVKQSSVTVLTCNLAGNQAAGFGGAIYVNAGSLVVKDSLFSTNTADNGGGIHIEAYGKAVTMDKTVFLKNVARYGGGLNIFSPAVVKISRSTFTGNSAVSGAGTSVLFADQPKSPMLFDSCQFTVNTASDPEGAGAVEINFVNEIRLVNTIFEENVASGVTANILVTQSEGDLTTIRVKSGVLTNVKGNYNKSFIIVLSP